MKKDQDNDSCKVRCKCHKMRWVVGTGLFLFVNVIVLDVIPNNAYLTDLKFQITGTRVSLNLLTDLCKGFEGTSEEEKISKGFYTKFDEYSRRYINDTAELIKMSDQHHRQSQEIKDALIKFDQFNSKTVSTITRSNSCPFPLPSQDDLWIKELEATMKFPNSLPEYITFYVKRIFAIMTSAYPKEQKVLLKLEKENWDSSITK